MRYEFEDLVILFLSFEEATKSYDGCTLTFTDSMSDFIEEYNLRHSSRSLDFGERIISIYVKGKDITVDFILELEDVLDSPITLTNRYIGSSETMHSLGLD